MSTPALNDFSDRISPVLVKELRQGMRAKSFIGVFLGLQVFLFIVLLSVGSATTASGDAGGSALSGILFTLFSVALLVLQPLRGVNALHGEIKDNTIDMMVLTRLTASRVVLGKWIAIASQSLLLLATVVPYLILRYFFGGMELVQELMFILLIFATSLSLTAVTVGLSACTNVLIRGLLPIITLPCLLITTLAAAFSSGSTPLDFLSMSTPEAWWGVSAFLLILVYLGYSMLSMGASLIAPAAENHVVGRRVFALLMIAAVAAGGWFGGYEDEFHYMLVLIVAAPALVIALTDSTPHVDSAVRGFLRFGLAGRLVSRFFAPTWSSGAMFSVCFTLLCGVAFAAFRNSSQMMGFRDAEEWVILISLLGGLLFPGIWQALFFRGDGQRLTNFLLVLVCSLVMFWIIAMAADATNSGALVLAFGWHPFGWLASLNVHPRVISEDSALAGAVLLLALYLVILGIRALMIARRETNPGTEPAATP